MQHLIGKLTKDLEDYAQEHDLPELATMAEAIQREHEYRMAKSREESRRAMARYFRSVISDYAKGIKRRRRAEDGGTCYDCKFCRGKYPEYICIAHTGESVEWGEYCSRWEEAR